MAGDQTLFTNAEGIERLWEVSQPLLEHPPEVQLYRVGSWGPPAMRDLIAPRLWRSLRAGMASEAVTVRGGSSPREDHRARRVLSHDGHVIVCGLHGVGLRTVELLHRSRVPVVVVDDDPDPDWPPWWRGGA